MAQIHPTALVDPAAELGNDVSIGAYTMVGPHVRIGDGTVVGPHCVIEGHTTIGRENRIFQFASVGADPQDKKYKGEPTKLIIGDRNTIREFTTFNTGTVQDKGQTQIGDDNWIMAYVHVAHDCVIGNDNTIANSVQFAGHVTVGHHTLIGGMSGIHQFVRVGDYAMLGFQTRLSQDLPPFVMAAGNPGEVQNVHQEGPRRHGYSAERLSMLKQMYKLLYRKGLTLDAAKAEIEGLRGQTPEADVDIDNMLTFLAEASRGIVR
ncbi:acyl-ACP--UDP-N-acetylglucosamine O-acyltransferase [Aquabacterium sp.]|uniref:acyl-ACP--UDP-N-acetylglucosamine O-acyltransferase n=1 Tax=Aquabacterium sp. TaxID=1872578 RepID=UPI0035B4862F